MGLILTIIIVVAISTVVLGYLTSWDIFSKAYWKEALTLHLLVAFISGVMGGLGYCFYQIANADPNYKEVEIVSLKGTQSTSGSFFLGTGSIDSDPVYYFYVKAQDGGLNLDSVDASKTTLYETDDTPRLKYYNEKCNETGCYSVGFKPVALYVPKNTVKENYTVITNQ